MFVNYLSKCVNYIAPAGDTNAGAVSVAGAVTAAASTTGAAAGVPSTAPATGATAPGAAGAAGAMSLVSPAAPLADLPTLTCPRRPNLGHEGRPIMLRANHFQISMPRGFVHHYDVNIQPDKCPRKVSSTLLTFIFCLLLYLCWYHNIAIIYLIQYLLNISNESKCKCNIFLFL